MNTNKKDLSLCKQEKGKLIKIAGGEECVMKFMPNFDLHSSANSIYICCKISRRCADWAKHIYSSGEKNGNMCLSAFPKLGPT